MPGIPGSGGQVPKRAHQRHGHHSPNERPVTAIPVSGPVPVPPADPRWHPLAADWYESLAESGQSKFFEPSDWQVARWCAVQMTAVVAEGELNAAALGQIRGLMTDLLCTEASRRRAQIEVERAIAGPAAQVASLDDYRDRLGAS